MEHNTPWLSWAVELQSIAQCALAYCKDPFDRERFERIRTISAEMVAAQTGLPMERVQDLFCGETGYQTPKLDGRAAMVRAGKILLVRETSGLWALPGGWMDVGLTVGENVAREAREEAGVEVRPRRIVAALDWQRNNCTTPKAQSICKVFVLCDLLGGTFEENIETTESGWFSLEDLPPLAEEKTTCVQLELCLRAAQAEVWETVFD